MRLLVTCKLKLQKAYTAVFSPVINGSFSKVGADKVWANLITKYNSIPFVTK